MHTLLAVSWFKLTPRLLKFTLFGAEWVIWLLLVLSALSLALMLDRAFYFYRVRCNINLLTEELRKFLRNHDVRGAITYCKSHPTLEAQMILAGLQESERGTDAIIAAFRSAKTRLRLDLDKNLSILGTIGSNVAFVGLFGTALGIIKAFNDLKTHTAEASTLVMGSVSEALVATAVGIFVAVPAVAAFNLYGRVVKKHLAYMDSLAEVVISELANRPGDLKK